MEIRIDSNVCLDMASLRKLVSNKSICECADNHILTKKIITKNDKYWHKLAINPNGNFPWTALLLQTLLQKINSPVLLAPVGNSHLSLGIEVQHSLNFLFK